MKKIAVKNNWSEKVKNWITESIKKNILGNLQREQGKGRDKIKLKKTTITTKKRNRMLNLKKQK